MRALWCLFFGHADPQRVPFFGAHRCPRCLAILADDHVSTPIDWLRDKR